ncbi:MAG TPA: hypothetical protein VMS74_02365 [Acidimicrobiia bacterium]|nr:hypothetical protein [Acidimicrobiia bacterium]
MAESDLAVVLAGAWRPLVVRVLDARGWGTVDGLTSALDAGEAWLTAELADLLALPFADQGRGPLEVFQEAMRFPTAALAAAGMPAAVRDNVTANALPGDLYALAPASSRDLGEEVWTAHLAWGARKAAALRER